MDIIGRHMLAAEAIVGRLVLFICQKAATGIGKLSFDKRRKACRSLTKLYYCVQSLDEVTESIFRTASDFRSTETGEAWAVMNAINNHMRQVALATNMFIDLGGELHAGLEILDPALAECCNALYKSKFDFLSEMSDAIAWDHSSGSGRIILKMPRRTIRSEVLEDSYAAVAVALQNGDKAYWPDTWSPSEESPEVVLTWEDNAAADQFINHLAQHRKVLTEAKEKLRLLLKSSFSVEELLFQTDSHPYR